MIRSSWGRPALPGIRLAFLLGRPALPALQHELDRESEQHGDIVQAGTQNIPTQLRTVFLT